MAALKEAAAHMSKGRAAEKEGRLESLHTRISHVESFVGARKMVKTEPEQMASP